MVCHADGTSWVPGLVVMELIQDAQNARQMRQALKLVAPLPVVWPTAADCQRALTDFMASHLSHNLGLLDALIAACAIGSSATLCTFNVKRYRVVPGLVMASPTPGEACYTVWRKRASLALDRAEQPSGADGPRAGFWGIPCVFPCRAAAHPGRSGAALRRQITRVSGSTTDRSRPRRQCINLCPRIHV